MKRFLLIGVLILALFLVSCGSDHEEVNLNDVAYVMVWNGDKGVDRDLTDAEAKKVIKLYNSAGKSDKTTSGSDTTPEFGVRINYKNGKYISIMDFGYSGRPLQVQTSHGEQFFIDSKELSKYIEGLE